MKRRGLIIIGGVGIFLAGLIYYLVNVQEKTDTDALRTQSNVIENAVWDVLENNSDVHVIFETLRKGIPYDGNEMFGKLKLRTTMEGRFFVDTFSGHSWLELEYGEGMRTTFALHGMVFSKKGRGYKVNWDLTRKVAAEMSLPITYNQVQQILDYNQDSEHIAWTLGHNCTDYAIEIWNLVAKDKIPVENFGSLVTPKELTEYIKD